MNIIPYVHISTQVKNAQMSTIEKEIECQLTVPRRRYSSTPVSSFCIVNFLNVQIV